MSGIQIAASVQGLDGVINRFKRVRGRITGEVSTALDAQMRTALRTVQTGTPVKSGWARGGWEVSGHGSLERRLTNPVPYVPFLALGTRFMAPRAMLVAALARAAAEAEQDLPHAGARIMSNLTTEY